MHGYRGLYGGLGMRDIHERKRLKHKEHILDHMCILELAANLFGTTQAEDKLRRENVRSKEAANRLHNEVGRKVRMAARSGASPAIQKSTQRLRLLANFRTFDFPNRQNRWKLLIQLWQ